MKFMFTIACALFLSFPTLTLGYGGGGGYDTNAGGVSNGTTNRVIRTLTRGTKACKRLQWIYHYDCYRNTYAIAANQLNGKTGYEAARTVLVEVENSFARTVAENEDKTAPRLRRRSAEFRPIKTTARARANREFIAALDRGETKLLRSASDSNTHFIRIAEALNTNKVLLRSALMLVPRAPVTVALWLPLQVLQHEASDLSLPARRLPSPNV